MLDKSLKLLLDLFGVPEHRRAAVLGKILADIDKYLDVIIKERDAKIDEIRSEYGKTWDRLYADKLYLEKQIEQVKIERCQVHLLHEEGKDIVKLDISPSNLEESIYLTRDGDDVMVTLHKQYSWSSEHQEIVVPVEKLKELVNHVS
jgi:hypothetical protein